MTFLCQGYRMKRYVIFTPDASMTVFMIGIIFVVVTIDPLLMINHLVYIGAINCKYCLCSIEIDLKILIYNCMRTINIFEMIFEIALAKF